jgi:hypothetical protein
MSAGDQASMVELKQLNNKNDTENNQLDTL